MNYIITGDLGKHENPATIAVFQRIEKLTVPTALPGTWQRKEERVMTYSQLKVTDLIEFPVGTPYRDIIAEHKRIVRMPVFAGNHDHVVDATGVGVPVVEQMRHQGLAPVAVYFTGGQQMRQPDEERQDYYVPKQDIMVSLQMWYQAGRLKVNTGKDGSTQRELWRRYDQQLATFIELITQNHKTVYGGETDGTHHFDLAIAVALGCWWSTIRWGFETPAPWEDPSKKAYNALEGRDYETKPRAPDRPLHRR